GRDAPPSVRDARARGLRRPRRPDHGRFIAHVLPVALGPRPGRVRPRGRDPPPHLRHRRRLRDHRPRRDTGGRVRRPQRVRPRWDSSAAARVRARLPRRRGSIRAARRRLCRADRERARVHAGRGTDRRPGPDRPPEWSAASLTAMSQATLDWLGCATFRLTVGELVVFLDAYMDRVPAAPPVGLTTGDVDRADWVVVDHSHFDHVWGAETIARNTGARILGSYETVRVMEQAGVPVERLLPVAGGERVRLAPDVTVTAFPSQHSCIWSQSKMTDADEVCIGDLGLTYQEQQARFAALADWFGTLDAGVQAHLRETYQGAR